jgi:hypothetical protein
MIYNIVFQNTYGDPMKPLTQETFRLERDNPKILAASVMGGYQYNDSPHMGPSIIVVTDDDRNLAEREAKRLSNLMWAQRDRLKLNLPDAATAVKNALAAPKFPVALFDIGDNVGGGSAGDSTFLLEQLLAQKATGWVVVLYDPAAFAAAQKAGLDGAFNQLVGGKSDNAHGKPVRVQGKVRSLHAGRYIETAVRHGGGLVLEPRPHGRHRSRRLHARSCQLPRRPRANARVPTPSTKSSRLASTRSARRSSSPKAPSRPAPPTNQAAEIVMVDTPGATSVNPGRYEFKKARKDLWASGSDPAKHPQQVPAQKFFNAARLPAAAQHGFGEHRVVPAVAHTARQRRPAVEVGAQHHMVFAGDGRCAFDDFKPLVGRVLQLLGA